MLRGGRRTLPIASQGWVRVLPLPSPGGPDLSPPASPDPLPPLQWKVYEPYVCAKPLP